MATYSYILFLLVALGLCSLVNTFGMSHGLSRRSRTTSSSLRTSLWEADLSFNVEGDGGDGAEETNELVAHKEAKQIEIIKYKKLESAMDKALPPLKEYLKKKKKKKKVRCPLYSHLSRLSSSIRDPWKRALHMDDELKRMESRYHSLVGDDTPQLYFPLGSEFDYYDGKCVRPTEKAYELVLRQYYRSNLGREGVLRADDLVARYEKYNPSHSATTKMMKFAMAASMNAGDLQRTDYWLNRIEAKYELTLSTTDYPGYYIYNPLVDGLKNMNLSDRKAANRAMQILEKLGPRSNVATKCELFCSRRVYLEIMEYQARAYKGSEAFYRIEKVFRELQKNYESTGNHEMLKPSIEALTPVFRAAAKCSRDDRVAKMSTVLFDECVKLYNETGDPDFCPNRTICLLLNSIYARMTQRSRTVYHYTKKVEHLVQWMEEHGVEFNNPGDKAATFNLLLYNAESKMADNPMRNPLATRKMFEVVLNIFKKFHNGEIALSPNKSTYQIFLKACSKLPKGEARSKLAAKAFDLCRQNDCVTAEAVFKLHRADPEYTVSLLDSTDNLGFKREIFHF